jgi:hypothetical protein
MSKTTITAFSEINGNSKADADWVIGSIQIEIQDL